MYITLSNEIDASDLEVGRSFVR